MATIPDPHTGQQVPAWRQGSTGATAYTRGEAQRFARQLLQSETYRENLKQRIASNTLPPGVEQMLWHYAYGKPVETVVMKHDVEDLTELSLDELEQRAAALQTQLQEAKELEEALPGELVQGPWSK